jgi:hypothetical protein
VHAPFAVVVAGAMDGLPETIKLAATLLSLPLALVHPGSHAAVPPLLRGEKTESGCGWGKVPPPWNSRTVQLGIQPVGLGASTRRVDGMVTLRAGLTAGSSVNCSPLLSHHRESAPRRGQRRLGSRLR